MIKIDLKAILIVILSGVIAWLLYNKDVNIEGGATNIDISNQVDSLQCVIDSLEVVDYANTQIVEKIKWRYEKIYIPITPNSADSSYESIKDFRFKRYYGDSLRYDAQRLDSSK